MDKFMGLPAEKRKNIIDAALATFGKMGYKKASINDIATTAGISKGLVFHYFGNKKALYLYLMEFTGDIVMGEMNRRFDKNIPDFFDRIRLATEIKMSLLEKYPAILKFMGSMYYETDKEVAENIKGVLEQSEEFRGGLAFDGMDASKFKEGVDPQLVYNILIKFSEGYVSGAPGAAEPDFNKLLSEFEACLCLMKNNFYREEFL
ncbi:MAG: TetR/AcrR family transcriptional regulator [Oscillospiraceae bacterium]|nr:TetR/AcrR family transcriptional regulator [Oscillospiraceae bacterium]